MILLIPEKSVCWESKHMKKFYIFLSGFVCVFSLSGCSGFSRLPEINFVGKSWEEVVRIFASNPENYTMAELIC